ncbi:hypothetical protein C4D60_Mb04t09960 [Musa balbisiana]|uniref:Uncharacterized protein n=1 Tax=Musa balbisiana TaxID=52838 RepID=A0A4S8KAY9_MUSBA|nr:hypothetical protein C4D60_Mb04t09960 [Musa balbisiana]
MQFQSPLISENHQSTKVLTSWGGSDKIASSLREIGGTSKSEFEEEHMTADMIQETGKLQIRRKPGVSDTTFQFTEPSTPTNMHHNQVGSEVQAKASGDVANVMAAKAKLLLRELKIVKADLATAKERCAKLEEENKTLRENRQKGETPADDDLEDIVYLDDQGIEEEAEAYPIHQMQPFYSPLQSVPEGSSPVLPSSPSPSMQSSS